MPTSLSKILLLGLFGSVLSNLTAVAQSTPVPMPNAVSPNQSAQNKIDGRTIYTFVEKMPVYLDGGKGGLQNFITSHVRGAASGSGAYVTFVIDQAGKARYPALGPEPAESEAAVDSELATAFRSIGGFKPGYQNGKPVDVKMTVKITPPVKNQQ